MTGKRAILYARKSNKHDRTEEQSASVTDQLARDRAYCDERGWTVVGEFSDDGKSGLLDRGQRPGLDRALTVIEHSGADVLVTLWTSRLSRDERQRAEILDVLDLLKAEWHAVVDGGRIDRSTYAGYVTYGVHTIFDVAYSIRIGENWRNAHQKRIDAGLPKSTSPRFGYRYDTVAKAYVIHDAEADVVRDLYHRYVRGEGFTPLTTWLNAGGWRVAGTGNAWSVRTLNRFLDGGFPAGLISREADLRDRRGSHKPLITERRWLAYLAERERRAPLGKKASGADERWWLAGLARCGTCGGPTYVDSFRRPDGRSSALCSNHRANRDACKGVTILRAYVENAVGIWLLAHLDRLGALIGAEARTIADAAATAYGEAVAARDRMIDALADLEEARLLGDVEHAVYLRTRERLTARLRTTESALKQAASALEAPEPDPGLLRGAAETGWTADARAALRGVLDRVEIGHDALTIVPVTGEPVTVARAALTPRCGVLGCGRIHYTRGLCRSHAMRARNLGVFDALAWRVAEADAHPELTDLTPTVEDVEEVFAVARRR